MKSPRKWSPELVAKMRLVATVFASALERKQAFVELEQALDEVRELKERAEAENVYLRQEVQQAQLHGGIVCQSEGMRSVITMAEQVAVTDSTVLILGETGTGKEVLARAIHKSSARKNNPMITVNCAAMPGTLIESELFGREKGAYTGALTKQVGRFELADRSTIFLDEVGELSLEMQAKLLRVLQENSFERLGSSRTIEVDVRVIAATNRNLEQAVAAGKFRADLFYRLNVFPLTLPPLRERTEDIEPLAWTFIGELSEKMGKRIERIDKSDMDALLSHAWPGNVRELRNLIERSMILSTGPKLKLALPTTEHTPKAPEIMALAEREKQHILAALEMTHWRIRGKNGAAELLEIKPTTLEARMAKHGIQRPRTRAQ